MQAIETKYHGPGNVRGSRITAKCERGKLTVEWDHSTNSDGNHRRACRMLLEKFAREDAAQYPQTNPGTAFADHHWGDFLSGTLTDGRGVHVLIGRYSGLAMLRHAAIAGDEKGIGEALAAIQNEVEA